MSQSDHRPLIGSVFERKTSAFSGASHHPKLAGSSQTGFPVVQHRSKSAFARGRDELRRNGAVEPIRLKEVPIVQPANVIGGRPGSTTNFVGGRPTKPMAGTDDLRRQISEENEKKVENMTEEERDRERQEIIEQFGAGVGDLLKRVKEAREQRQTHEQENVDGIKPIDMSDRERPNLVVQVRPTSPETGDKIFTRSRASSPPSALSGSSTRPSSRADRKLRFAAVTPDDVYVYESAPASPRRKALALPPPPDIPDPSTISLGQWKGKLRPQTEGVETSAQSGSNPETEPEEGTPEYIRRRFFPNAPLRNPNLAWMELSSEPSASGSSSTLPSSLRFDLSGALIPASVSTTLPTHLGLHHHADGTHAGYTLDDLFLLSRSTVPAQRATMLDVLGRIARRMGKAKRDLSSGGIKELEGQEEKLRKRIVAAGIEAMSERGSLGAQAVGVIWECIVGWDEDVIGIEGIELKEAGEDAASGSEEDTISSLPLEYVLSQIATSIGQVSLSPHSLSQLLAILHRLAQHTNTIASAIVATPNLIANVIHTFLLTPFPPTENSPLPDPATFLFLNTLALSSRSNASALLEPADSLLRFVTTLPTASPYSLPLATALLTSTLRFYTTLASYGLYSNIATTAATYFTQVAKYVLSDACTSKPLMEAWAGLLEAWIVCAIDPHQTTPSHDILWSQVVGWDWGVDVLDVRRKLNATELLDWRVWTAVWRAEAAWLEGAKINGAKGGDEERRAAVEALRDGFESGHEKAVLLGAIDAIHRELTELQTIGDSKSAQKQIEHLRTLSTHAATISAALRLFVGSLPHESQPSPPFAFPVSHLSELSAKLVTHPLWASIRSEATPSYSSIFYRPVTSLLSNYLRLSRVLPGISQNLWMAQVFSVLCRLIPGDEEFGIQVISDVTSLINSELMVSHGLPVPAILWDRGGMKSIIPFLTHTVRPNADSYIGPTCITPQSISLSTTLRLPSTLSLRTGPNRSFGLPLTREWVLSPLDHLLRSATSTVFKSMPASWDASETEVARASLLLATVVREVLDRYSLNDFVMTREETVFGCMKVFMLEHNQPHGDSIEEVFRDAIVGKFMDDLLTPFTSGATPSLRVARDPSAEDLEKVATRFLGASIPFYQYYTDFVGLYDSISFSHPLFARLLLPPTSMRYAPDYRKHLWGDFRHVLKTIRTPIDQMITADLREYLWPIEADASMLSSYLQALVKGSLEGFIRLAAVHHISCNIWPDLRGEGHESQLAGKLLRAIVEQGGSAVAEIVQYRQTKSGQLLLPPECFGQHGVWRSARIAFIGRCLGNEMQIRLGGLLQDVIA